METTPHNNLTPIHVVPETWINRVFRNYKGVWLMLCFFVFVGFSWYLVYNLPFLMPGKVDVPYSYPAFSLTQGDYTVDVWYPKKIATNSHYPLIYTVSTTKTSKTTLDVSVDSIADNTSVQSTPDFGRLKFSFSEKRATRQQEIVDLYVPYSDDLASELEIAVTIKTPGGEESDSLKIPVSQVGWLRSWYQIALVLISGFFTFISQIQLGFANITSLLNSRQEIKN